MILDAAEHVAEIVERIDAARLARGHERVKTREALAGVDVSHEKVIFPSKSEVPVHSAHVAFRARVHYPWHPSFGRDLDVLYRESRRGEAVHVCLMPDGTGEVVPVWMFDSVACASMARGMPRASVKALELARAILDELRSDARAATHDGRCTEERKNATEETQREGTDRVADVHPFRLDGASRRDDARCGDRTPRATSPRSGKPASMRRGAR